MANKVGLHWTKSTKSVQGSDRGIRSQQGLSYTVVKRPRSTGGGLCFGYWGMSSLSIKDKFFIKIPCNNGNRSFHSSWKVTKLLHETYYHPRLLFLNLLVSMDFITFSFLTVLGLYILQFVISYNKDIKTSAEIWHFDVLLDLILKMVSGETSKRQISSLIFTAKCLNEKFKSVH